MWTLSKVMDASMDFLSFILSGPFPINVSPAARRHIPSVTLSFLFYSYGRSLSFPSHYPPFHLSVSWRVQCIYLHNPHVRRPCVIPKGTPCTPQYNNPAPPPSTLAVAPGCHCSRLHACCRLTVRIQTFRQRSRFIP